jgi:DNA-binding winged helix-turn-helix (wHTH) protein
MARLRAKLETPGGPQMFITEPRSGYRLKAEEGPGEGREGPGGAFTSR